jgi:zinc transporter ZupT
LVSLYFADLLPDVLQLGGIPSLGIIVAVWLVYSFFHNKHVEHHEHSHVHLPDSSAFLMISMISHCFSSGMLLFMSHELSSKVAATVFLALIGHKGYEALSVSVLLNQRVKDSKTFTACAVAYAGSFPIGVLVTAGLTRYFSSGVSPEIVKNFAMIVASVAVGSLAGCMINDFLLPSIRHLKTRKLQAGWMLVGIALTVVFTVGVPG